MNRVVMQEMNILFIQVRNGIEQGYDSPRAAYHQYREGNKPALVFSVIHNPYLNRGGFFADCHLFLIPDYTAPQIGEFMHARMTLRFIILGFPDTPAGLAALTGRMSDAPVSTLMASSMPVFPSEGESAGWVP